MTKQELLDATIQHFIIESKPFGYDQEKRRCVYTGCAIGIHLVKAGVYQPGMDESGGLIVQQIAEEYPTAWEKTFGVLNVDFARDIQTAHDDTALYYDFDIEELFERLTIITEEHELTMPTLDEVWLQRRLYANQAVAQQLS